MMTINVAALCETGGRKANQDNIYLSCRAALRQSEAEGHAEYSGAGIALPGEGAVLAVADGMGGMNAGEVASRLVVEALGHEMQAWAGQPVDDPERAAAIARRAIVEADKAIKQYVAAHPMAAGTGSTVAMLWLLGDKAVVAWCGDSRCYRYNPRRGLELLSHDHSYVQQLVDEGKLRPEQAFGHDQSNIITRCLSDDKEVAEPDVKVVDVYRDDMFLLCSDGLCGLLPDMVTEQLVKDADGDVNRALANCWRRGAAEGWSDNVSIILASVGGVEAEAPVRMAEPPTPRPTYTTAPTEAEGPSVAHSAAKRPEKARRPMWPLVVVAILAVGIALWLLRAPKPKATKAQPRATAGQAVEPTSGTAPAIAYTPNRAEPSAASTMGQHIDSATGSDSTNPTGLIQASGE